MSPFSLRARSGLALCLLAVLAACADSSHSLPYYGRRSTSGFAPTKTYDHFLGVRGTKKKKPGQFSIAYPCDLWGPFRWEVAAGLLDPKHESGAAGAVFGTELDGRGPFPPTVFYGIAAQVFSTGLNVYAYTHQSTQAIGTKFYQGAKEVEFAIESNGAQLTFLARKRGDPTFDVIAQVAFSQNEPLVPTIGGFNLLNKAAVGFDDFRIVQNGSPPGVPTPEQAAAAKICAALAPMLEAGYALDGVAPDWATASNQVADALAKLDLAIEDVKSLASSKARKKALGKLEKARKKLVAAQKAVAKQKVGKITKTIGTLRKAAVSAGKASTVLYPID